MAARSAKLPRSVNEQDDSDLKVEMVSVQDLEGKHGDLDAFAKQSRRNIREAKRQEEKDLADRISNWREKNGKQTVSRAEVSRHNRKADAWVIVDGVVYDVTGFIDQHPGGPELLLKRAGQDVTQTFKDLGHSRLASYILSEMYVGDLPVIERINYEGSGSEDEDYVSSDDEAKHNPVVDMRPKQGNTELDRVITSSVIHTPQVARLDRPVPNRYRKRVAHGKKGRSEDSGDQSHASLSSSAQESAERSRAEEGPSGEGSEERGGSAPGGVAHVVSSVQRKDNLPRPVPTTWQVVRYSLSSRAAASQLARDVAKALRHQIFLHRAELLGSVCVLIFSLVLWSIPLPPWLLGHPEPDGPSIGETGKAGGVLSSDNLHDKVAARTDRSALHVAPPPGHDVGAVLYF